jgi:4'-phosphopantetheinyl transferase
MHGQVEFWLDSITRRCTDGTKVEQIDSGQIHLWLAYLDQIRDARLLAEFRALLSEEELRQLVRFHFERDRHRYLVTRAMQRSVLSKYADVAPSSWRFTVNDYGRPSIAVEHVAAAGIEFNLSHTDGLVVMGVARERAIGVDVENVRTREADIEIADRYFAPEEVAELRTLPGGKQGQRFFEYWTLKESYIKARGMGLSIPLDRFALHLEDPERIWLTIDTSLQDHAERWLFWQLRLTHDHLTAVCAMDGGSDRPYLAAVRSWP